MRGILFGSVVIVGLATTAASAQVGTPGSGAGGRATGIPPVTDMGPRDGTTTGGAAPVAPTGKVKPPGSPLGQDDGKAAALDRRQRELDRRIRTGICRGC